MRERKKLRFTGYDYSTPGSYFVTICVHEHKCVLGEIKNGKITLNEFGSIVDKQWNWLFDRYNYIRKDEFINRPDHFHGIIHIIGNENVFYNMSKNDDYIGNSRGNFVGNGNGHYIGNGNNHFVGNDNNNYIGIGNDNFVVGNGRDRSLQKICDDSQQNDHDGSQQIPPHSRQTNDYSKQNIDKHNDDHLQFDINNSQPNNDGSNQTIDKITKIKPLPELIGAFKTTSSKWVHRTGFIDFQWQKSYHDHIIRNTEELDRIREYINNNPLKWHMESNDLSKKIFINPSLEI